jgi:hypothetical protein
LLAGLTVTEKEMGVLFGKVLFRTLQRCVEFRRCVRHAFGRDIPAKIRNRLVRIDTQATDDQGKGKTIQ